MGLMAALQPLPRKALCRIGEQTNKTNSWRTCWSSSVPAFTKYFLSFTLKTILFSGDEVKIRKLIHFFFTDKREINYCFLKFV